MKGQQSNGAAIAELRELLGDTKDEVAKGDSAGARAKWTKSALEARNPFPFNLQSLSSPNRNSI